MPEHLTPKEAHAKIKAEPATVYVDVRSVEEFEAGHAQGAWNIPLNLYDAASGRMVPNPDFVKVVQAHFKPDAPLVLGCKGGGRSMTACGVLGQLGYQKLYNLAGGYSGKGDQAPGWEQSGLPVSTDNAGPQSYAQLKAKA